MATFPNKRQPQPGGYDRSGQLMVEYWAVQDTDPKRPLITLTCPECGAPAVNGRVCRELYEELLKLEARDPAGAGAVHNLSVLCYVLQHPHDYSDAALNWGIASLRKLVGSDQASGDSRPVRRRRFTWGSFPLLFRRRSEMRGSNGNFSGNRPNLPSKWQMTVDQVYHPDPGGHPERVRCWARAILGDLEQVAAR